MMESMMDIDEDDEEDDYRNWSELHGDILLMVIERVFSHSTIEDYIRFGCVCRSWRSIYVRSNCIRRLPTRNRLPVLMIPIPKDSTRGNNDYNVKNREEYKEANKDTMNKRSFYSLKDNKVNNDFRLNVPENRYCYGSSFGWLVTVDMDDSSDFVVPNEKNAGEFLIRLVNPFLPINCNEINLPSLRTFPHVRNHSVSNFWQMNKAILSANPTNTNDYIVIAIYSGMRRLAFCKRGDTHWTDVPTKWKEFLFMDVIYYNGLVYGLDELGVVVACDISDSNRQKITRIVEGPSDSIISCGTKYIVESSGDLFQVHRNVRTSDGDSDSDSDGDGDGDDDAYFTDDIQVFKLQVEMNQPKWIQVNTLDGHAFFVGDNGSMSLLASDFPGCKPNAIYFTDDNVLMFVYDLSAGPHDMGVFNVEDEIFEPHYQPTNSEAASLWPTPIWVEPTPFLRN